MPFTEDRAVYFRPEDFGDEGLYTPAGSSAAAVKVNGIFNEGYASALGDAIGESKPWFHCNLDDVPAIAKGDGWVIKGVSYIVAGPPEPDGTGMVILMLREA